MRVETRDYTTRWALNCDQPTCGKVIDGKTREYRIMRDDGLHVLSNYLCEDCAEKHGAHFESVMRVRAGLD